MKVIRLCCALFLLFMVTSGAVAWAALIASAQAVQLPPDADITRNPVNLKEKNPPTDWNVGEGKRKNIKWVQDIGTRGYSNPVVSGGRVFMATNNGQPRDPLIKGQRAILMCFREKDGQFLWQAVHNMPLPEPIQQGLPDLCSVPTVDGDRVYYVTPACQVVCANVRNGKAVWIYDLMKTLKVFPHIIHYGSPLLVGDRLFVVTGNGTDEKDKVAAPNAPSFVALEKRTGKLLWQSALPGDKIIAGQWSSPVYAEVGGQGQVLFPGGDGVLYSLEPATGALIWKFRCTPLKGTRQEQKMPNYPMATPVVHGRRVYVSLGNAECLAPGNSVGHLYCVDITMKGDVSPVNDNFDPSAPENKNSALVWHFGGVVAGKGGRPNQFGPTLSRCAVNDGLLYISEEAGYFYCLDAANGQKLWEHDLKDTIWGSPYWVDGKVYVAGVDGGVRIFLHGRQKKLLPEEPDMDGSVQSTPVMANGVMYIATKNKLYAIANK